MAEVYVHDLSYALGDQALDVEVSAQVGRTLTSAELLRSAGFAQHHVCRPTTSAYDLAKRAVAPIRAELKGIGVILYATCLPQNGHLGDEAQFAESRDVKHLMDFPASHLQADFGLSEASVIGLNQQACTSMLGSLRLSRALLASEPELSRVLCVSADRFPPHALYEQAYNLISDGAAACIVSRQRCGYRLVACHAITNGALSQASDDETVGSYFSYTHTLIERTLAKAGLTMNDIDWVVPQNTNIVAWRVLARILRYDCERVYFGSIASVGHIISADNVVNLLELEAQRTVRSGARLLLLMAGFGLNWQAVVLEKV